MWLKEIRKLGIRIPFQYHDECLLDVPEKEVENTKVKIKLAMENLNKKYPLNVPVGCSIEIGKNYAETH